MAEPPLLCTHAQVPVLPPGPHLRCRVNRPANPCASTHHLRVLPPLLAQISTMRGMQVLPPGKSSCPGRKLPDQQMGFDPETVTQKPR